MRKSLTIEVLESRDMPSAGPVLVELPRWDAPTSLHPAEVRSLLPNGPAPTGSASPLALNPVGTGAGLSGIASETSAVQRWDRLLVGTWYVPAANLLAYLVGPAGTNPVPIADQTVFHITRARNGVFSGENTVQLSRPTALGWLRPEPMQFLMTGVVTPQGRIRITFTPTGSGEPRVTGVGTMQFVDGAWRMTMQMATGVAPYVIHWANMTKLSRGETPPAAVEPTADGSLRSEEWRWLLDTRWALTDTELFGTSIGFGQAQGAGVFQIEGYRNGYFWGKGMGPTPFSVVGSVTPEGQVFLVLTAVGEKPVTRTGRLQQTADGWWVMRFRSYEDSPAFGVAWLLSDGGTAPRWHGRQLEGASALGAQIAGVSARPAA